MARLPRRLRSALRSAACFVALFLGSAALAISYTVQVIAVSDQDGAIAIYRDLARDGFPAYVVRTTGAQGDVYRVRVGAFANRSAALRYAESMPDVAGSRPVPALAEAIPQGIMPLAPRLLWQYEWAGEDVRVLPWPGGVAVRVQRGDPLRQAVYHVFQDGGERSFSAWAAVPLRQLPDVPDTDLLGVPMVDLTTPAAAPTPEPAPAAPGDAAVGDDDPDVTDEGVEADEGAEASPAPEAEVLAEAEEEFGWGAYLADADDAVAEAGLALLRDRTLWPPSWETDTSDVRLAFRGSLETIVARALDVSVADVQALAYAPGGEPPPALIVLDVSDPSGRDSGNLLALADPQRGLRPSGAQIVIPDEAAYALPAWPSTRVRPETSAPEGGVGGETWQALPDDGFVRLTLPDGATWRAGVGAPIWSDGTVVLAWDGRLLLLYDFVPR